jgi:predicted RND superfamily exporter protein
MQQRRPSPRWALLLHFAHLTTALAFLAFVPTSFVGMAQLGIIASGGMVIAFLASITLIPAMLKLIPDNQTKIERKLAHKVAVEASTRQQPLLCEHAGHRVRHHCGRYRAGNVPAGPV